MQDAQDPSAAVPVDLPFFQPKCFSHYDPSTIFFYYIFIYNLLIYTLLAFGEGVTSLSQLFKLLLPYLTFYEK